MVITKTLEVELVWFSGMSWARSLRSRRLEVVAERENGRARGSFSCALFFLCPLLPSDYDFRGLVKGVGLNIGMGGVS